MSIPLLRRLALALASVGLALILGCASGSVDPDAPLDGLEGRYRVLLPPGYPDEGPYPTIYFLHEFFGDESILWRQGIVEELSEGMAAGEMPPFVLVAPDGRKGFWSDFHETDRNYETWVTEGLRRRIESRYAVRTGRAHRAVTGISMGGFGALKLALRNPHLYATAGSLSGAVGPLTWEGVETIRWPLGWSLRRVFGDSPTDNSLAENDVRRLIQRPWPGDAPRPTLYLRCGEQDKYDLATAARTLAEQARQRGFSVELHLEDGTHRWRYWRRSAVETIAWHARAFATDGESHE